MNIHLIVENEFLQIDSNEILKNSNQIKMTFDNVVIYEGDINNYLPISINSFDNVGIVKLYVNINKTWLFVEKKVIKRNLVTITLNEINSILLDFKLDVKELIIHD